MITTKYELSKLDGELFSELVRSFWAAGRGAEVLRAPPDLEWCTGLDNSGIDQLRRCGVTTGNRTYMTILAKMDKESMHESETARHFPRWDDADQEAAEAIVQEKKLRQRAIALEEKALREEPLEIDDEQPYAKIARRHPNNPVARQNEIVEAVRFLVALDAPSTHMLLIAGLEQRRRSS